MKLHYKLWLSSIFFFFLLSISKIKSTAWLYDSNLRTLFVSGSEYSSCNQIGYDTPYIGYQSAFILFGNESNSLPIGWGHTDGLDTKCSIYIDYDISSTGLSNSDIYSAQLTYPFVSSSCTCAWEVVSAGTVVSTSSISCSVSPAQSIFILNKSFITSIFNISIRITNTAPCGLAALNTGFSENYRLALKLNDNVVFNPPNLDTTQEHNIDWTTVPQVFTFTTYLSPNNSSTLQTASLLFVLQVVLIVIALLICIGLGALISLLLYFRQHKIQTSTCEAQTPLTQEMDEVVAFEKSFPSPTDEEHPSKHLLAKVSDDEETKE